MAAEAARVLDYPDSGYYGSTAPAREPYSYPETKPFEAPFPDEQAFPGVRTRQAAAQRRQSVSLFAFFGSIFAAVLMVFVVLAQISYSEIAGETVRLKGQLDELLEQERRLEIEFESAIDMKEIERYARDALGMSKPVPDQIPIVLRMPVDSAEIIEDNSDEGLLSGLGSFMSSLLEYFKR